MYDSYINLSQDKGNVMIQIGTWILAIFGALVAILLLSLFSTFLWFCFDDKLAEILNCPAIGHIPWYNVWPFTIFISSLFKTSVSTSKNSN